MKKPEFLCYVSLVIGTFAVILITACTGHPVNPIFATACLGLELALVGSAVL